MDYTYKKILPEMIFITFSPTAGEDRSAERRPSGNDFMDLFAQVIHERGHMPLKQLAPMMGITRDALSGAILAMSGMTMREWRDRYLLLMTKSLLGQSKAQILELHRMLGFGDRSAFYRFCDRMGYPLAKR